MGVGSMLESTFGGGNSYKYKMPPELEQKINQQYGMLDNGIQGAQTQRLPQNVLDMAQANQAATGQQGLADYLNSQKAQNLNFGTGQNLDQEQALIGQLIAQGRGEGPNPAMEQLKMTTDQGNRNAAAMIASQRGINPALAARMVGGEQAANNQAAAGQAALMSAQQQLAAQNAAGGMLGQRIGQLTQQTGMNADQQARTAALLSQQQNAMRQAGIQQASAQGQAGLGLMQNRTNTEMGRRQAQMGQEKLLADMYANANAINVGVAGQNASTEGQYGMGAMSGISSALGNAAKMFADGGKVPSLAEAVLERSKTRKYSDGSFYVAPQSFDMNGSSMQISDTSRAMIYQKAQAQAMADIAHAGSKLKENMADAGNPLHGLIKNFTANPVTNANSLSLTDAAPMDLSAPGAIAVASDGGKIPGKASVKGNSVKNDTVPALLSPGEIIIPREALGSKAEAFAFLDKAMRKHEGGRSNELEHLSHGGKVAGCYFCGGRV